MITKNELFVQVPVCVLEADMPASHILGFQRLLCKCFRDHSDLVRGTHRGIARMLRVAKTSFITMLPRWIEAGWISLENVGKELVLTLHREQLQSVPLRTTADTSSVPLVLFRDTFVPEQDSSVPMRDESVPTLSSKQTVISNNITDTLKEENNNVTPIIFHTDPPVPELTVELALQLVSHVLPAPKKPAGGAELERWVQKWANPAQKILARLAPVTGPLAWQEMDEVTRYMAWEGSGWRRSGRGLPTLESVEKNWDIQVSQITRMGWRPTETTPYPGVPQWDTNEEPLPMGAERAQPFTHEYELESFGSALQASHPLELSIQDLPNGFLLLAQIGPDDFFAIDPEIWDNPSSSELDLIYQAIAYGSACACNEQRQAETIAI